MKLIDYVIKKDEDINNIKELAKEADMSLNDYILTGYCPCGFTCLTNTGYDKPYSKYKKDKSDCTYRYSENQDKCNECWGREVLVISEF